MDRPQTDKRADPHRRLQRHTHREGPDFLFLATRGGRPPGSRGGERLRALRSRSRCVRTASEQGIAATLAPGVSRASLHRWRRRHAEGGLEAGGVTWSGFGRNVTDIRRTNGGSTRGRDEVGGRGR